MPVYTYRRKDGTTFDIRQPFSDEALATCPQTGQKVTRLIQAAGIIFRGSGFYVNDSKKSSANGNRKRPADDKPAPDAKSKKDADSPAKTDAPAAARSEKAPTAKSDSA